MYIMLKKAIYNIKLPRCLTGSIVFLALITWQNGTAQQAEQQKIEKFRRSIHHIIVIYEENWSFDGLYGKFPGCTNLEEAGKIQQVDRLGKPLNALPRPRPGPDADSSVRPIFPFAMPVAPYDLLPYVGLNQRSSNMVHSFYTEQLQIDKGKMDKFVGWSDNGGLTLSYYDITGLPEGQLALQFTLCDHFFHSAFGGSFLNHIWLIAAATPVWKNAPADLISQPDPDKPEFTDNTVTPDGFIVNTADPVNHPHSPDLSTNYLVPEQMTPTIGDRLNEKNISWAWYSGGWENALHGRPDPSFQYHHQPFVYFANYRDGSKLKARHLKDEKQFIKALKGKNLPSVCFVKPLGKYNEHPGYATLQAGQKHLASLTKKIMKSRYWKDCVIIITYDENGGRWDHVSPPLADRWGPGTRIPAVIVSPFARRGYIDHTSYETVSILKFIETRFDLEPLGTRDSSAANLLNAFEF